MAFIPEESKVPSSSIGDISIVITDYLDGVTQMEFHMIFI